MQKCHTPVVGFRVVKKQTYTISLSLQHYRYCVPVTSEVRGGVYAPPRFHHQVQMAEADQQSSTHADVQTGEDANRQ